ncbi:hydroxysteroid dehydrogenase-like protein 2 [Plakobranchus ocellatus]|uniref:Hydroxysteroid dehydrogenase-like protein 2 n=1 Tax=Plakobranchus ocellatus TaxID=259542 RepID=A0AAV4AA50_9GAST|nr:hydroxysteroid dehydrogenase-like protein 2 [Plakobranchus ocellatus]
MAANTGVLAGKTVFISGASRGIGKAIALKVAKDGANVVIAAKTATAHPKLPGTIYTAAEEIKQAGGQALPCVVDIRNEEQVLSTVKEAVSKFGGIDILVNNASAISLTPTLKTPMKTYDLMNGINARGTYLCSQACLPHLLKSENPHILNISPPLNLNPKWFKGHVAYTMAKYGMSFCVLGMSEEFREEGVAVNALWPRTAIWTAAMEMLGGGGEVKENCRSVDIMSDAAYVMLTRNSREFTGNFSIDDEVLQSAGVSDLEQYSCVPGGTLLPDFFLDVGPDDPKLKGSINVSSGSKSKEQGGNRIPEAFTAMESLLTEQLVNEIKASYQFNLSGDEEGQWFIDLKSGAGSVGQGMLESPDCTMTLDSGLFLDMFAGKANSTTAFMMGKLKIKGDMMSAMKLEKLMKKMQKKA